MPIISFTVLHYGSDYLGHAIKSIYDCVDKVLIAYAPSPSHGHSSNSINPDSREACYNAAFQFGDPKDKIKWIDGAWSNEGIHRNVAFEQYPDADLISVIDADEIWHPEQFSKVTEWCLKQNAREYKQRLRTPWRSFNWICDDQMMPDRFYRPKMSGFTYVPAELGHFYHMGYAREPQHIEYKLSCHGHKNELKQRWFEDVFMKWSPTNNIPDLHPTCGDNTWCAKPFNRLELPKVLHSHPYWDKEII